MRVVLCRRSDHSNSHATLARGKVAVAVTDCGQQIAADRYLHVCLQARSLPSRETLIVVVASMSLRLAEATIAANSPMVAFLQPQPEKQTHFRAMHARARATKAEVASAPASSIESAAEKVAADEPKSNLRPLTTLHHRH